MKRYDVAVVGAGPNGFAAAIAAQQAGLSVVILEAEEKVGGGVRSEALTLPGFVHDIGSAIHPLGVGSPFFTTLPLEEHGLEWVYPEAAVAHPLDGGQALLLTRSVADTAAQLGIDRKAYINLMQPIVDRWEDIAPAFLGPLRWPEHPFSLARFGLKAVQSAGGLAHRTFKGAPARAFFGGLAAHSMLPLNKLVSAGVGLVLGALGHVVGWPFPKGGSQQLTNALLSYFSSLGGEVITQHRVTSIRDVPPCRVTLLDITPAQMLTIEGLSFGSAYQRQLKRFTYNQGIFKLDWALEEPIPFTNDSCQQAATIHLGGSLEEIAESERMIWKNQHSESPYVLLVHQTPFDSSRAPEGKHTAWAYCHVPRYSEVDMTSAIEKQVERFAPGFRDTVLKRHTMNTVQVQQYNANYIGGDINGGAQTLMQLFTRPVLSLTPYRTPIEGVYICSSSTPPGGGVHGMCGYYAAKTALEDVFDKKIGLKN